MCLRTFVFNHMEKRHSVVHVEGCIHVEGCKVISYFLDGAMFSLAHYSAHCTVGSISIQVSTSLFAYLRLE
jgi:hypothetical protein